jgi:tRNA (mo5U34)-methyltransferase
MRFQSLHEALDPDDANRTVEGWPAPHRVVVTAISP